MKYFKYFLAITALLAAAMRLTPQTPPGGQSSPGTGAYISGTPVVNNCAKWINATTIGDSGGVCGGAGAIGGSGTAGQAALFSASTTLTSTPIIYASQLAGADAGAKIQAAINAQATNGGWVIADFFGSQTISSQVAVKQGVWVQSYNTSYTCSIPSATIVAGTGASRTTNVVTITTSASHGFATGQLVVILGVTDTTFNGSFIIASTPTSTTFTYAQTAPNATSGSGTAGLSCIWVQQGARLLGAGTFGGAPTGTIFAAGTNLNAPVIHGLNSGGIPNNWWHWGEVGWLRIDGNGVNQTANAPCLQTDWAGEVSELHHIIGVNCKFDGIQYNGTMAGSSSTRNVSMFLISSSTGYPYAFRLVRQKHYMEAITTDSAPTAAVYVNPPASGNGFKLTINALKAEGLAAGTNNDPVILIDQPGAASIPATILITGMHVSTSFQETAGNLVKFTGTAGSAPHVTIMDSYFDRFLSGQQSIGYVNVYNDVPNSITVTASQAAPGGQIAFWTNSPSGAMFNSGYGVQRYPITLSNGANQNVNLGPSGMQLAGFVSISGPSAAFNIGGFQAYWDSFFTGQGATDGRLLTIINTTAQPMTINNQDAGSSANNRIITGTGANVTLPSGTGAVTFVYEQADSRWVMLGKQASEENVVSLDDIALAAADTNKIQHKFSRPATIKRLSCSTDVGTVDIQLDVRAEATPNTAGTNTMSGVLTCNTTTGATTTFSAGTLTANQVLNLQISNLVSSPTVLRVHVQYALN